MPEEPGLLPHEAAFTALFALMATRLALAAGCFSPPTLIYAALTLLLPATAALARHATARHATARHATARHAAARWPTPWPGRARLVLCVPLMGFVFQNLRHTEPLLNPTHLDPLLQALDLRLFGLSLPTWFDGRLGPVPTEALSLCYSLFFLYLLAATIGWLFAPPAKARAFYAGLFTLYATGFLAYTLVPALGPYATMPFAHPLRGYAITRFLLATVPTGTNLCDAFPSLHCAVTAFILGFDAAFGSRRRAACCALPVAALWLSTLALRFHYATDVLAGFILAALCLALAATLLRAPRPTPHPTATLSAQS